MEVMSAPELISVPILKLLAPVMVRSDFTIDTDELLIISTPFADVALLPVLTPIKLIGAASEIGPVVEIVLF